ncbi:DMT family transporter [Candidatus Entotheonella palauensis]|uniref:DMT family transporter n=1 Tax=Candidatus Entotheonella palauensis TaxID=93172 RepID=UPI000B7D5821|nr:DMT family transporter [Candidatus Entotheonella palauensis]
MTHRAWTPASGFIYLLLSTISSSTIPITVKIGLRNDLSPLEFIVFRMGLAAIALWSYLLCFKPQVLRIDSAGILRCVQAAMVNCVSMFCYVLALSYIDVSLSIMVYTTAYIPAVMLILMIRGEHPSWLDGFRFLLALLGIYLFIALQGQVSLTGIALILVTALFFGLHVSLIQLRLGAYNPLTVTLYIITSMTVISSAMYLAAGYRWPHFNTETWVTMFWFAIVGTAISRLLLFAGINQAGSRQAALISPLENVLALLLAVLLLGEWLTWPQWIGASMVVVSVALGAKAK